MSGQLRNYIENLSDEALFGVLQNPGDYTPDALDIARAEMKKRGLSLPSTTEAIEAPAKAPENLEKPVLLRFIEGMFEAYRNFWPQGIRLTLVLAGVYFFALAGIMAIVLSMNESLGFTGWGIFGALVDSQHLGEGLLTNVVSMVVFAVVGVYAIYFYRLKAENRSHELSLGGFFKEMDASYIVLFVAVPVMSGVAYWILDMIKGSIGAHNYDPMGFGGWSGDIVSNNFMVYIGNLFDFIKLMVPAFITGVFVSTAVARNNGIFILKRGWRYILVVALFILVTDTVWNTGYYYFDAYISDLPGILISNMHFLIAVKSIFFMVFVALTIPGLAAAYAVPFLPDRSEYRFVEKDDLLDE